MNKKRIFENDVYTGEELKEFSLINTGESFADLLIYMRGEEIFLLEKVDGKRFRVHLKY